MISSPVERMATLGRRTTCDLAPADRGEDARSRARSAASPCRRTSSPRAMSVPAKRDPGPGRDRPLDEQPARRPTTGACSTMTTASAPRGSIAPGGDRRGRPRPDRRPGDDPRGELLGVEPEPPRRLLGRAEGLLGADRVAVDVRAVEGRHVDPGDDVVGQHPAQRLGQRRPPPASSTAAGRAPTSGARPCRGRRRRGTVLARGPCGSSRSRPVASISRRARP